MCGSGGWSDLAAGFRRFGARCATTSKSKSSGSKAKSSCSQTIVFGGTNTGIDVELSGQSKAQNCARSTCNCVPQSWQIAQCPRWASNSQRASRLCSHMVRSCKSNGSPHRDFQHFRLCPLDEPLCTRPVRPHGVVQPRSLGKQDNGTTVLQVSQEPPKGKRRFAIHGHHAVPTYPFPILGKQAPVQRMAGIVRVHGKDRSTNAARAGQPPRQTRAIPQGHVRSCKYQPSKHDAGTFRNARNNATNSSWERHWTA